MAEKEKRQKIRRKRKMSEEIRKEEKNKGKGN